MKITKGFFDALFSDYLLPHEKRILAYVIAIVLCVASFLTCAHVMLNLTTMRYDRPTDSIVITLGKTEFTRQNHHNP